MSTIYHPFENRIISEEEAKQISDAAFREIEREAKQKANDDYSFDESFNIYIQGKHYETENGWVAFVRFESEYDCLYAYYQYTKRFISAFVKDADNIAREHEEAGYGGLDLPAGELIKINYESILMMAYTTFESFLREFIELIDEKAGVLQKPYDDTTTLQYLKFLHFDKNIFIPRKLYRQYDQVRLVRNYFAHSLSEPQAQLLKQLKEDDPCNILGKIGVDDCLFLNERYMEFAFATLGKVVKSIEKAFEKYYPELQ